MELGNLITNTSSMLDGIWVDFDTTSKVKIAKFDNPNYRAFVQGQRTEGAILEDGRASDELVDLMCNAMSETVLLDWEGFTLRGEEVPYSKEAAYRLLREFEPFRNQIILMAQTQQNFADEEFEEALNKIGPF